MKKRLKIKKIIVLISIPIIVLITIKLLDKPKENKTNNNSTEQTNKYPEYYRKEYQERYSSYQEKNKDLPFEQVIIDVNIGLDYNYYENTQEVKELNKVDILVNKYNYLPANYIPDNLEDIDLQYARSGMKLVNYAKEAFEKMAKDAKEDGLNIIAMSSYRSYDYQVNLYNRYKEQDGIEQADTYSARPGYSEHQTALAVDVYNGKVDYTSFEETKEFNWMQENAYKYGFILRFPKDKVRETGYQYEAWHYRYVGIDIATNIHNNNICLEEYMAKKKDD